MSLWPDPMSVLVFALALSIFCFLVACWEQFKLRQMVWTQWPRKKLLLSVGTQVLCLLNAVMVAYVAPLV